ncbi:MAG: permease-like cell division protein FtsX [Bacteroidales bacterium]|nr:permease-like cell division protein FtsX [Bacteroidales bacterium]MDZ4204372.1 permease-like cell division protein FtsX [Bacteroidales bacterium]
MASNEDKFTKRKLRSSYATTIVSISLVLFMLGLLGLVMLHGHKLSVFIRENIALSVIIKEAASENDIAAFRKSLVATDYVKGVEYITREQAAKELQDALGEEFISFIGYNPLLPSFEVKLQAPWSNVDSMHVIEKKLLANHNVQEVIYQKSLVHLVNENIRKISLVLLAFNFLLMIVAIALINNTIRLSIYSKRFLIRSMQLVGATEGFIRRPFLFRGILNGFYGAVFALALLAGTLYFARLEIPELVALQDFWMFALLTAAVMVFGLLIALISTYFSVRKFLRASLDNLYQ